MRRHGRDLADIKLRPDGWTTLPGQGRQLLGVVSVRHERLVRSRHRGADRNRRLGGPGISRKRSAFSGPLTAAGAGGSRLEKSVLAGQSIKPRGGTAPRGRQDARKGREMKTET